MIPDPHAQLEDRLRTALRSTPVPTSLSAEERLARLRTSQEGERSGGRRVTPARAMAGVGSVTAAVAVVILSVNGLGSAEMVRTDRGDSAARAAESAASESSASTEVDAVYEVPNYDYNGLSRAARIYGRLGGQLVGNMVCLWVDDDYGTRKGLILQTGSAAQVNPVRLIGPDGQLVATEGDRIEGAGGNSDGAPSGCEGLVTNQASMVGVVNLSAEDAPEG